MILLFTKLKIFSLLPIHVKFKIQISTPTGVSNGSVNHNHMGPNGHPRYSQHMERDARGGYGPPSYGNSYPSYPPQPPPPFLALRASTCTTTKVARYVPRVDTRHQRKRTSASSALQVSSQGARTHRPLVLPVMAESGQPRTRRFVQHAQREDTVGAPRLLAPTARRESSPRAGRDTVRVRLR